MLKYSLAPWNIEKTQSSPKNWIQIVDKVGLLVAQVRRCDLENRSKLNQTDAQLIAAAPDMYEALKEAQKVLAMFIEPNAIQQTTVINAYAQAVEIEHKARAVLTKARGE